MVASARLTQAGNTFEGAGTDDHNNSPFNIAEGKITSGGEVRFYRNTPERNQPQSSTQAKCVWWTPWVTRGLHHMEGEYVTAFNRKNN